MATKANWHVAGISDVDLEPDPFAAPIEEVGKRIDLTDPRARLEIRLQELLAREGRLFNAGITCPIKDRSDSCCHACPVSQAHDEEQALGALCRLGREQEIVLTEMAVHQHRGK